MSSQSSHHPQEILLALFSLYVHKGGLKPDSFHFISCVIQVEPDMIICPFLTKRIPEQLWSNDRVPCLVVHPGIEGDRGKHSLDWALHQNSSQWGVTVLEPSDEMDAGDIWSTKRFKVQRDDLDTLTKSSLYANEVTDAATSAVLEAVENFTLGVNPRPLDYSNPVVKGETNR